MNRKKKNKDNDAKRAKAEAKRFARHMENERIRHRLESGDNWVAERMEKITGLEDLAEASLPSQTNHLEH